MKRLFRSFSYAAQGVLYAVSSEPNMRIHLLASAAAIGMGLIFNLSRGEWGMLCLTIFMVLVAETINTALERIVDLISPDYHSLARSAKDLAAGAVLLTALNAIIMAVIIFGPYMKILIMN